MTKPKKYFKNAIALLTVFSLLMGVFPFQVFAATTVTVIEPTVDSITDTTANVYSTAYIKTDNVDNAEVRQRGIVISTKANDSNPPISKTTSETRDSFVINVTGLNPRQTYFVRTYLKYSKAGESAEITEFSTEVPFTTQASKVTVAKPTIEQPYNLEAKFSSSYKSNSLNVTEAGFVYSTSSTPTTENTNPLYESKSNLEGSVTKNVTNLASNTTYYVRAYVRLSDSSIVYSDTASFTTYSSSSTPTLEIYKNDTKYTDRHIYSKAKVSSGGTSSITSRGFVYSATNNTPTVSDSKVESNTSDNTFELSFPVDTTKDKFYVRAYATNSSGTSYSDTVTVTLGDDKPVVNTGNISNINTTVADVEIDVIKMGSSTITERGVVYSTTTSMPEIYNSTTKYKSATGTTGKATVNLTNLEARTRYYVRAYARNDSGVSYGEVKEFLTVENGGVKTKEVTNIKGLTATATAEVLELSGYALQEKGFVYSRKNALPTIEDLKVSTDSTTNGEYSLQLSGLEEKTSYYVRAFVKTSQGITYGNVVTFDTTPKDGTITISYKTPDEATVSTQSIIKPISTKLTVADLLVPSGYKLYDPSWTHTVTQSTNVNVYIKKDSTTSPIPTPPATKTEKVFIEGAGNKTFAPDRATTRIEVAQIIYNLAQDKGSVTQTASFTDVPNNYYAKDAIDYVYSKGYMQGYPDGSFKPGATITRAEVCVVLNTVYGLSGSATNNFKDVPQSYWGYKFISLASSNSMIFGYPDGSFKPGNNITRAEIATLFCNSEKRSLQPLGTDEFTDVPSTHWAYKFIMNSSVPK